MPRAPRPSRRDSSSENNRSEGRPDYMPTSPEPEDFGDVGDVGEVAAIVSKETTTLRQSFYEIKWRGWAREDGTDTTWEQGPLEGADGYEDAVEAWNRAQADQAKEELKRAQSEHSCGIDIEAVTWLTEGVLLPMADVAIAESAQAYQEKLESVGQHELRDMINQMNQIMGAPPPSNVRNRQPSPMLVSSSGTSPSPPTMPTMRSRIIDSPESPPKSPTTVAFSADDEIFPEADDEAADSEEDNPGSSSSESPQPPVRRKQPPRNVRHHPIRDQLNKRWGEVAEELGAASIRFVNDVDDEDAPIPPDYQYLENSYIFSSAAEQDKVRDVGKLEGCWCTACPVSGCSDDSDDIEHLIHGPPNYDGKGYFIHKGLDMVGQTVVECNEKCSCNSTCPNRVAQRVRRIPLEVFKTTSRGWGLRSPRRIHAGRVIGIFTGEVMYAISLEWYPLDQLTAWSRERARALSDMTSERHSYIFDLDSQEDQEVNLDNSEGKWSVDSFHCGNWSRFINHSCVPNMLVVPVVWDTDKRSNICYLAFVAKKTIESHQELTIDYNPHLPREPMSYNSDDTEGVECTCKSATKCRGRLC